LHQRALSSVVQRQKSIGLQCTEAVGDPEKLLRLQLPPKIIEGAFHIRSYASTSKLNCSTHNSLYILGRVVPFRPVLAKAGCSTWESFGFSTSPRVTGLDPSARKRGALRDLDACGACPSTQAGVPVPHENGEKVAVHVQDRGDFCYDR
jgi:hypothetical protein